MSQSLLEHPTGPFLLPTPRYEPPYDDERTDAPLAAPPFGVVQGTLALTFGPAVSGTAATRPLASGASAYGTTAAATTAAAAAALGTAATSRGVQAPRGLGVSPPAASDRRVGLRLVPGREPEPGARPSHAGAEANLKADPDAVFAPQPTPRAALPDPTAWAGRLAQALVEVLSGDRPTAQLVRWLDPDVLVKVRHGVASERSRARDVPGLARAVIRSVHVSEPADGVAEVCTLVRRGVRSTAMALRLEGIDGRWQCTALELG